MSLLLPQLKHRRLSKCLTLYFHNSIVLDPQYPPRPLSLHRWKDEVSVNINLERQAIGPPREYIYPSTSPQ